MRCAGEGTMKTRRLGVTPEFRSWVAKNGFDEIAVQTAVDIIRDSCAAGISFGDDEDEIDARIRGRLPAITLPELTIAYREYTIEAAEIARRAETELALFKAWASEQSARGRPETDLTFGNFVSETGVLQRR
jgi:hypothetical protein